MLMVPQTWDRMVKDGGEYAAQLCRRCAILKQSPILTEKDAMVFLTESLPGEPVEDLRPAAKILASEANKFGALSLLSVAAQAMANRPLLPGQTYAEHATNVAAGYRARHQLSISIPRIAAA